MKAKANKKDSNAKKIKDDSSHKNVKVIIPSLIVGILLVAIVQINFDSLLPIKKIRAQGEFDKVTEQMILDAVKDDVNGGYLKINVHNLQTKIEKLAWVKRASVRRVWPDSIVVTIEEQKAYAIWKNKGLLNNLGEQFEPKVIGDMHLPILNGPDNLNIKVMNKYKIFESILNKIDLSISVFNLDDRRAVTMQLSNNIKVSLGRSEYQKRLKRFITAYKLSLNKYANNIEYIDMRYTNGFSIKWKDNTQTAKAGNVLRGVLDV